MPLETPRKRILLLAAYWEERFLQGVAEYAREAGWVLDLPFRHHRTSGRAPAWVGDGVIANTQGDRTLIDWLTSVDVPVVAADTATPVPGAPIVIHDERAIGPIAVGHFAALGFRAVACVTPTAGPLSIRDRSVETAARAAGMRFRRVAVDRLAEAVADKDFPRALIAHNDTVAGEAVNVLTRAGHAVPRDFAVMGVDDDEILCTLGLVPLTSVNLGFRERGRRCAELLDAMMAGRPAPVGVIHTPIPGVTARLSTDTLAITHPETAAALRYIRENFRRPIGPAEIGGAAGVSVRRVQAVFREQTGMTLGEEIARLRLEAASRALENPENKIEAVASACGYSGRLHLLRAFRRSTGLSPREWRKRNGFTRAT